MKISRYITFPLIFGLLMAIPVILSKFIVGLPINKTEILIWLIYGVVFGFGTQLFSDYKVRKVKNNAIEKDFDVRQTKSFVLFYDYDQTFELCLESINLVDRSVCLNSDIANGIIKAKTNLTLLSFGNRFQFKISKLTEFTSEVEISTSPFPSTALVDYGEGLKIIKTIENFFQNKNEELQRLALNEKEKMPIDEFFVKHKESVFSK